MSWAKFLSEFFRSHLVTLDINKETQEGDKDRERSGTFTKEENSIFSSAFDSAADG
jgi:hypothetical protein